MVIRPGGSAHRGGSSPGRPVAGGALVLGYLLGLVAAAVHPEARPFTTHPSGHPLIAHHPGQAFASDHSTAAFAIALVALVFLARRRDNGPVTEGWCRWSLRAGHQLLEGRRNALAGAFAALPGVSGS